MQNAKCGFDAGDCGIDVMREGMFLVDIDPMKPEVGSCTYEIDLDVNDI